MALINKDKLLNEVREFQNVPGYVYNAIVTRPEVDRIPVEWLINNRKNLSGLAVRSIVQMYREEKEAEHAR